MGSVSSTFSAKVNEASYRPVYNRGEEGGRLGSDVLLVVDG